MGKGVALDPERRIRLSLGHLAPPFSWLCPHGRLRLPAELGIPQAPLGGCLGIAVAGLGRVADMPSTRRRLLLVFVLVIAWTLGSTWSASAEPTNRLGPALAPAVPSRTPGRGEAGFSRAGDARRRAHDHRRPERRHRRRLHDRIHLPLAGCPVPEHTGHDQRMRLHRRRTLRLGEPSRSASTT